MDAGTCNLHVWNSADGGSRRCKVKKRGREVLYFANVMKENVFSIASHTKTRVSNLT